jgi:hypothetical protein
MLYDIPVFHREINVRDPLVQTAYTTLDSPGEWRFEAQCSLRLPLRCYSNLTTVPLRALCWAASMTRNTAMASRGSTGGGPPVTSASCKSA